MEYDRTGEYSPEWDYCWQWLTWSYMYEYMKIIYENCGVKNYMKEDHCSYRHKKKAWRIDNLCNDYFQTHFDSKIDYHIGCDV